MEEKFFKLEHYKEEPVEITKEESFKFLNDIQINSSKRWRKDIEDITDSYVRVKKVNITCSNQSVSVEVIVGFLDETISLEKVILKNGSPVFFYQVNNLKKESGKFNYKEDEYLKKYLIDKYPMEMEVFVERLRNSSLYN
ncbi:MAG: hypothetical protein E6469_12665 [Clostridium perfringens]|uniref:hypothetical protein n=1 Tax=Clostridium perfringens TaxID=1502 RepID=UPI0013E2F634|nr:hypothetical protein [Clostridium perfringens]ELC8344114.1 hypothetical protein [Clostridium perfringens]MBI6048830.1 hypothetical protein [Clostridium perfringens]MDB2046500.1 hypothetical protein [Clostridium perfringens]MDB2058343.1 hypothetical protein [Clostridium perfringens]MDJ8927781.1 hypothetical protein [Clostridium perfringens]